jgi:hypothetical protein
MSRTSFEQRLVGRIEALDSVSTEQQRSNQLQRPLTNLGFMKQFLGLQVRKTGRFAPPPQHRRCARGTTTSAELAPSERTRHHISKYKRYFKERNV